MPRTAVAYSNWVPNGELADPAGTAITSGAGNGGQVPATSSPRSLPELTLIRLSNASGGGGTATVLAGAAGTSFVAAGQGNLTTTSIANGATRWIGPFESSRFLQADGGSIIVETSVNMTMTAFRVPRNT